LKYRVFGITSLCEGSPFKFEGSEHIFMYDFDDIPEQWVLEEALRLHYKWGIEIYVLKSSERNYQLVSFDILPWRLVQSIQADVRLPSDYPLIGERYWDKFLTLRISKKGKKESPKFLKAFTNPPSKYEKSLTHYLIYKEFCGLPKLPKGKWKIVKPYFAAYETRHGVT